MQMDDKCLTDYIKKTWRGLAFQIPDLVWGGTKIIPAGLVVYIYVDIIYT